MEPRPASPRAALLIVVAAISLAAALLPARPAFAVDGTPDTSLVLARGAQKVLTFDEIARIAVGDPEVADVRPLGKTQVLVKASRPGRTSLLVWTADGVRHEYTVTVR